MTLAKADVIAPYWPLYLSREEAARFVGVSPNLFEAEVVSGKWPKGELRGLKGGRVTWYRPALEAAAAARNGGGEADDYESRKARYQNRGQAQRRRRQNLPLSSKDRPTDQGGTGHTGI